MPENIRKFTDQLAASLAAGTFVKLTLGNYKGIEEQLQKIHVRLVETKKGSRLFVQYKYETRDIVRNYDFKDGIALIERQLGSGFRNGHLFTTEHDIQLDIGKRNSRLNIGKPSIRKKPSAAHDREKHSLVDQDAYYLRLLGITTDSGEVRAAQRDKWKQINKFVEVLAGLYERSGLAGKDPLRAVDMGSGKGYLTFAAYDLFTKRMGLRVSMTGVDVRREQVDFCNEVARSGGYDGLEFVVGTIAEYDPGDVDILIALHACDTATDDAIYQGISHNARIIVAAPCCHREIRRQIEPPPVLRPLLRHPVMQERTAEMITDGVRALLLERSGYDTRMFEFVATEHTPKNNMIVAVKGIEAHREAAAAEAVTELMDEFGISGQRLRDLLDTAGAAS